MSESVGTARSPGRAVSRRCVGVLAGLFAVGLVLGLVGLITDQDAASSGQGVAVANGVHVVIGVTAAAVTLAAHRRDPERLRRFLIHPFTEAAWRRLLDASLALPCALAVLVLALVGRGTTIARIERWRTERTGDARPAPAGERTVAAAATVRRVLGALVTGVPASLAAVIVWFMPVRAGEQVFAALDPDFTRDAWGGPGYLGASAAHWMDGVLAFYLATAVICWLAAKRTSLAQRPISAAKTRQGDGQMTK